MDVYHFRLIYDTVSFVGVSIAAALVCFSFCVARKAKYQQRRARRATGLPDEPEEGQHQKRQSCPQMVRGWMARARQTMPALYKPTRRTPSSKNLPCPGATA